MRWGYITQNPAVLTGPNRHAPQRAIRVLTFNELDAIAEELSPIYRSLPQFAAATGLRTHEWIPLERRDIDRSSGYLNIARTLSDGEVVELGKTNNSLRQVPLSPRALEALDNIPAHLGTRLLFPSPPEHSCTSTTSATGNGHRPSKRRAYQGQPASTICARRSPATPWPLASVCSSWRGSWARRSR
jgi:integrase